MSEVKQNNSWFTDVTGFISSSVGFDISAIFTGGMITWFWCWSATVVIQQTNSDTPSKTIEALELDSSGVPYIVPPQDLPSPTPLTWLSGTLQEWFGSSPRWLASFIGALDKIPHNTVLFSLGILIILTISMFAGGVILNNGSKGSSKSDMGMHSFVLLIIMVLAEYWGSMAPIMGWLFAGALFPVVAACVSDLILEKDITANSVWGYIAYSMLTVGGWFMLVIGLPLLATINIVRLFLGNAHRTYSRTPVTF